MNLLIDFMHILNINFKITILIPTDKCIFKIDQAESSKSIIIVSFLFSVLGTTGTGTDFSL